jgi:hypothetical protein
MGTDSKIHSKVLYPMKVIKKSAVFAVILRMSLKRVSIGATLASEADSEMSEASEADMVDLEAAERA